MRESSSALTSTCSRAIGATLSQEPTMRTPSSRCTRGTSSASGSSGSPRVPATRPRPGTGFVYGDFRRVHRTGLIASQYRAAEWRSKEVELAAHDLLQELDGKRA